jgi:hypothetical protein
MYTKGITDYALQDTIGFKIYAKLPTYVYLWQEVKKQKPLLLTTIPANKIVGTIVGYWINPANEQVWLQVRSIKNRLIGVPSAMGPKKGGGRTANGFPQLKIEELIEKIAREKPDVKSLDKQKEEQKQKYKEDYNKSPFEDVAKFSNSITDIFKGIGSTLPIVLGGALLLILLKRK